MSLSALREALGKMKGHFDGDSLEWQNDADDLSDLLFNNAESLIEVVEAFALVLSDAVGDPHIYPNESVVDLNQTTVKRGRAALALLEEKP